MIRRVWLIRYKLKSAGVWSDEWTVNFAATDRIDARVLAVSYLQAPIDRKLGMHGIKPGHISAFKIVSVTPNM